MSYNEFNHLKLDYELSRYELTFWRIKTNIGFQIFDGSDLNF